MNVPMNVRPAAAWKVLLLGLAAIVLPIVLTFMVGEALLPEGMRNAVPAPIAAALALLGYRWCMQRIERRRVDELASKGAAIELGAGILLGVAIGLACLAPLAVAGLVKAQGLGSWLALPRSAALMVLVACFEEVLMRGLLYRLAERLWGTTWALSISVVLFVLAHLPGDHVSLLGLAVTAAAGAGLAAAYLLTRRLWLPIGLHFAWNFLFDGVLSIPVSGHAPHGWLQMQLQGPEWLSGGAYGIEASVVSLIVWTLFAGLMLRRSMRRQRWQQRPSRMAVSTPSGI